MNHHTPVVTAKATSGDERRPPARRRRLCAAAPRAAMPTSTRVEAHGAAHVPAHPEDGGRRHARRYGALEGRDERGGEEHHQRTAPGSWSRRRAARRTWRTTRGQRSSVSPRRPSRNVRAVRMDDRSSLGQERRDDDHHREERDEGLPGQRDAAVEELDLQQALPHPPDQESFQPGSLSGHGLARFAGGARMSSSARGVISGSIIRARPPKGVTQSA